MKKFVLYIVFLFSLVSCEENIRFNNPSVQGLKNNMFWRAIDSKATVASDGSVLIEGYKGNEVLSLKIKSAKVEKYRLGVSDSTSVAFVETQGNNQLVYKTGAGVGDGQIIITKYDDVNGTISGSFKFNAKGKDSESEVGPILNFQQGVFYQIPITVKAVAN